MAQIKIFGLREHLMPKRKQLSDAIHDCVVDALRFPQDKRFHRFILLERDDFAFPASRTSRYTIIEINLFEGHSAATKKNLIRLLYERIASICAIDANDLEIVLFETPRANWGIRGKPGDELALEYVVDR